MNSTRRALAVAAMIGALGFTGAAIASADTLVELNPRDNAGAYCIVTDDDGTTQLLYRSIDCQVAQSQIDAEQRREDRREDRRDERRAAQERKVQEARDARAAERAADITWSGSSAR